MDITLHKRIILEHNFLIKMRDGVNLASNIFRPDDDKKYPVILIRTPYSKDLLSSGNFIEPTRVVKNNYVYVLQDVRGRYESEGKFEPFKNELKDGYDTIEILAKQKWCDGNIGIYGASYMGFAAWMASLSNPQHLKTAIFEITSPNIYDDWLFQNGVLRLGFIISWLAFHFVPDAITRIKNTKSFDITSVSDFLGNLFKQLPISEIEVLKKYAPYFSEWLKHKKEDKYWDEIFKDDYLEKIKIPILHIAGWHDLFLNGSINYFNKLEGLGLNFNKFLIGPWCHQLPLSNLVGEIDFGFKSSQFGIDKEGLFIKWFDRWLKNIPNGIENEEKIKVFVMGSNYWKKESNLFSNSINTKTYYLSSKTRANSVSGDGFLIEDLKNQDSCGKDMFLSDPQNPVSTIGGYLCCYPPILKMGVYDRSFIEKREDVLVYTSLQLDNLIEISGYPKLSIWVETSTGSADFNITLIDVFPDGKSINVCDGITRIMGINGPVKVEFSLWPTWYVFKKYHYIRLEIAGSNFPKFERNLGKGKNFLFSDNWSPVIQTLLHKESCISKIELPIK